MPGSTKNERRSWRHCGNRCLARVRDEYGSNPANLSILTRQDSIVINIQRACEAAIDLAMHFVAQKSLGIPQTSREAFALLETAGILTEDTAKQMRSMVGFRNIAVHSYQELGIEVLQAVIEKHLDDFSRFLDDCENHRQ